MELSLGLNKFTCCWKMFFTCSIAFGEKNDLIAA